MAQGEIKTITEMDLQLTEKMATISATLEFMQKTMDNGFKTTNDHLAQLNGKVLKQEKELDSQHRRLTDFENFKDAVEGGAREEARAEAKKIAERSAGVRSILVSVASFVVVAIVAFLIIKFFHFNPFTGTRQ